MSYTWAGATPPPRRPIGPGGLLRIVLRGGAILAIILVAFPLLLILRGPERIASGTARPVTPRITQGVCIAVCAILGLRRDVRGSPLDGPGAFVANHVGWIDIFVLNATTRLTFVAKSEVAHWPGIGWLAKGTDTVFIDRDRRAAADQAALLRGRLQAGNRLLFFPEGTSSDGQRVLPFRSTLFAPFLTAGLADDFRIQPISLSYSAPPTEVASFYGWWGDMDFGRSLADMLAAPRHGAVRVIFHAPIRVRDARDRKALAKRAEAAVRSGL